MLKLEKILPISSLRKNMKGIIALVKSDEYPVVLTLNGKAELIVQDIQSYRDLMKMAQYACAKMDNDT